MRREAEEERKVDGMNRQVLLPARMPPLLFARGALFRGTARWRVAAAAEIVPFYHLSCLSAGPNEKWREMEGIRVIQVATGAQPSGARRRESPQR